MRLFRASVLLLLLLLPRTSHAEGVSWSYDVVAGGTCKQLVQRWSSKGVTEADGTTHPGKWAVTTSKLLIGSTPADAEGALDGIEFKEEVKPKSGKVKQTCVVWKDFDFDLHAEHHVTALDWQHGLSPDSKCAKEWKRVKDAIQAHEPLHVADVDALVEASNQRVQKLKPITGCGNDLKAARTKAAKAVNEKLKKEIAKIRSDAEKKAKQRDVETADMKCPCEEKLAFKGVDLFCDFKTPVCTLRTGQKVQAEVCGNPLTANWTVTPEYYTTGCGATPGGGGNKPFDNDCVAEGSAEEKRRIELHKNAPGGAGGWFCVYGE
ncbi:MAG TPA: hypothetical protein VHM70_23895, partial [Polyangiaceae bacterium]|nr:hypothetical protein [Polyangiaceae bacterium]